ncbi:MMPL family transporter [Nocardioides sp.]|uniref:MMPL family transporter n=1 Tax=Nocardioides sp. TaxID=35761 RepID=UPI00263626C9|nr:MMPL family transporter [Nocardioides sp.]
MTRIVRALVPILLVAAWLAAGAFGGPLFGRVSEVATNDATTFLPSNAEATEVQRQLGDFLGKDAVPAVVVITGSGQMTPQTRRVIDHASAGLRESVDGVVAVSPMIPSDDGHAAEIFVELDASGETSDQVDALNRHLDAALADAPGLRHYVTGPAGFSADLSGAFAGVDLLLLGVALGAVMIILFIVYRAPLVALAVVATSMMALCAALGVVWLLAREGVLLLNGQSQGILFILVIGAATDYGLLYVARYREELARHRARTPATLAAWRASWEPILASAGTVIAGLLCLLFSQLQSNRDLGPIAAIGIAFAMLAAFTLLPALLWIGGATAYWPGRLPHDHRDGVLPSRGVWARLPRSLERRPRRTWIGVALLLGVACLGAFGFKAGGVAQSELVLGTSDARTGQQVLAEHFPAGSGSPAYVVTGASEAVAVARTLVAHDGVAAVTAVSPDSPAGTIRFVGGVFKGQPREVGGRVLLEATLTDPFDSPAAEATVRTLRSDLGARAQIGGSTATEIDTNAASAHDRKLITPLVLLVILVILALLLRAVVAPLLLILTTVLSFGATLGVSALVFNHLFDFPGADPAVPLFAFVFLVALGVDYNIFLMTRVREEAVRHGTAAGIGRGLAITGGVITSAGLVLAATFAALAVLPILFLAQIAFIVAFGVLLDTFVVRTLLVPALAFDIGRRIWWPSALGRPGQAPQSDEGATAT